jgi:hypothetical protein
VRQVFSETPTANVDKTVEVNESVTIEEASSQIQAGWSGLVLIALTDKEELVSGINFLTAQSVAIKKKKKIRIIVFNQLPAKKIESLFTNLGCAEILEFKSGGKTVVHKMQRHMKLIQDDSGAEEDADESGASSQKSRDDEKPSIKSVPALTHPSDFWLTRSPVDAKRAMNRWNIELIGPGPSAGQWVPNGNKAYEWQAKDPKGPFSSSLGRWIFVGRMVQFFEHTHRWRFMGDKISLSFYEGDKPVAERFSSESDMVISVAENSTHAKEKMPQIEESFEGKDWGVVEGKSDKETDGDFHYQEEVRKAKELELDNKEDEKKDWNNLSQEDPEATEINSLESKTEEALALNNHQSEPAQAASPGTCAAQGSQITDEAVWKDDDHPSSEALGETKKQLKIDRSILNYDKGVSKSAREKKSNYVEEEFSTMEDAFKKVRLNSTINGKHAEILEIMDQRLILSTDASGLTANASATLKIMTENMRPQGHLLSKCKIIHIESDASLGDSQITIQLDEQSEKDWKIILLAVESRQMNILRFLKLAKGA